MMMLGGSPLMVAAPPRLAAKISPMIMGTGSNRRKCARRAVATTRNKTTVMLSTNMDSSAASTIKLSMRGMGRNPNALARRRQTQSKKPASLIASTMIIMPARKRMVLQLIPTLNSVTPPWANQNWGLTKLSTLRASRAAAGLPIVPSSTTKTIAPPAASVRRYRGYFPWRSAENNTIAMIRAKIWLSIDSLPFPCQSKNLPALSQYRSRMTAMLMATTITAAGAEYLQ